MNNATIEDSAAVEQKLLTSSKRCPCCIAIYDHLSDWHLASLAAEYAHQFSLETYVEMIDAHFASCGADQFGMSKNSCHIGDTIVGPKYLDPPFACVDFWGGPMMRLTHIETYNMRHDTVNIRLNEVCNTLSEQRKQAETPIRSWYESIVDRFCPANRQLTWDALRTGEINMPPEFRNMCDFMLCELDTWLYWQDDAPRSRVLACQYAVQKMPPGPSAAASR